VLWLQMLNVLIFLCGVHFIGLSHGSGCTAARTSVFRKDLSDVAL
jgi:hypothetical protein